MPSLEVITRPTSSNGRTLHRHMKYDLQGRLIDLLEDETQRHEHIDYDSAGRTIRKTTYGTTVGLAVYSPNVVLKWDYAFTELDHGMVVTSSFEDGAKTIGTKTYRDGVLENEQAAGGQSGSTGDQAVLLCDGWRPARLLDG